MTVRILAISLFTFLSSDVLETPPRLSRVLSVTNLILSAFNCLNLSSLVIFRISLALNLTRLHRLLSHPLLRVLLHS